MVVRSRLWKASFQRKNSRDQAHTGSHRIGQEGALLCTSGCATQLVREGPSVIRLTHLTLAGKSSGVMVLREGRKRCSIIFSCAITGLQVMGRKETRWRDESVALAC